jgi:hypothetical protein
LASKRFLISALLVWLELSVAEYSGGKKHNAAEKLEDSFKDDPDEAEGKEQQPHDGVGEKGQDGDRPRQDEKKYPEKERDHGCGMLVVVMHIPGIAAFMPTHEIRGGSTRGTVGA